MSDKKLVRYQQDRMVWGVASGLAQYLDIDVVIIRLLFVVLTLAGGPGLIVYIVMAVLMPEVDAPVAKGTVLDDDEDIVIKQG